MNKTLDYYVRIYKNVLPPDLCDSTVADIETAPWTQHEFYDPNTNSTGVVSGENELDTCSGFVTRHEEIMKALWDSYAQYIQDNNFHWYNSWQGFSYPRYNRYLPGRVMAKHCDHIQSLFDGERKGIPTLTALAGLNDGYTGGGLVFFDGDTIELGKGDIAVFPSNFLFPHQVKEVTEGVRYSFVSWAW